MSTGDKALSLLRETTYFKDAPEALVTELAERMIPVSVEGGHIFFEEGQDIHSVLILEEGIVHRTKLSTDESLKDDLRSSIRDLPKHKRAQTLAIHTILVDKIHGRGRVTGLLHNFQEGGHSFATVIAAGPVKAWLIEGEDFREVITSQPEFSLHIMQVLR